MLCLLQNSCTAAVIVLFLGYCLSLNLFLSLNLSYKSALCVALPSMHHKKYIYSMLAAMLATGFHVLFQLHPQCHTPYMGDYLRWAFIDKDRAFTLGVYSRRAFNQVNTVYHRTCQKIEMEALGSCICQQKLFQFLLLLKLEKGAQY